MNINECVRLKEQLTLSDWHLVAALIVFADHHRSEFEARAGALAGAKLARIVEED